MADAPNYSKGLAGVIADESSICLVDGDNGRLYYRGYAIAGVAEKRDFVDTAFLLLYGHFPDRTEKTAFQAKIAGYSALPDYLADIVRVLALKKGVKFHPMEVLQAVTALIRTRTVPDLKNLGEAREHVISCASMFPTIVAAFHRQRRGMEPVAPRTDLAPMTNFLYMLHGKEIDKEDARVFDICQILQMEHGFNASTFAGRVVGSTLSPVNTSLSAAVAGLFGSLHGGADEQAFLMARDTIGSPDKAEKWVMDALARKEKIMGFGHRVYKTTDPRARILDPLAARMVERGKGNAPAYRTLQVVQKTAEREMKEKGKELGINVDFYKGIVLDALGIPTDMFTTMFAISRVWGWGAHLVELWGDHRLYRPKAFYTGEKDLPVPDPA